MRHSKYLNWRLAAIILLTTTFIACEARGGRGRGGGTFGGIFGGWRKHRKTSSNGGGRRVINGDPVHYSHTVNGGGNSHTGISASSSSIKTGGHSKVHHTSYPKQQMPLGWSAAQLPPGGSYHASAAAMPPGAIYYPQAPMRSSSGTDFLFGMMAGHVMSNTLFGHRPYMTHVYHQQQPNENGAPAKVIIINNGENQTTTTTGNENNFWPTSTDVPLAPFNASITTQVAINATEKPIFDRNFVTSDTQQTPVEMQPESAESNPMVTATATSQQNPYPGGIICMPMIFNETDPNDATQTINVEKTVCFPAPPPPPPTPPMPIGDITDDVNCIKENVTVVDPTDGKKIIQKPQCSFVGDITEESQSIEE